MTLEHYSIEDLFLKRKRLRRELLSSTNLRPLRIAVLGGSTTNEVVDLLELHLLAEGFQPQFYQSEYGRFYEEATLDTAKLDDFAPEIIYLHTSVKNIQSNPSPGCSEKDLNALVVEEVARFQKTWDALENRYPSQIIQNNFEMPEYALFGNMDGTVSSGRSRLVNKLNEAFASIAGSKQRLMLQDINRLAAHLGLSRWFDFDRWYSYKLPITPEGNVAIARSLTSIIIAIYGKARKVLVLDLDNTLWGGVIGDDGLDGIQIGHETAVAEAYLTFQEYCLHLRQRGILLAVCSKNDNAVAKQGFSHPESLLRLNHFAAFKANWEPKFENILAIADELSLSPDSFVFIDDNPAERSIVRAQIQGIAVPEIGADVSRFASIIEEGRFFEPSSVTQEDLGRAALYQANSARSSFQQTFADYGEYLDSLEMHAEIAGFTPLYLDRIAQLTNKTNQFNLTTRRYTVAEMQAIAANEQYLGLYGKLSDRFGDNGLISVLLARRDSALLHIDLWLMSCRVLKREMELAMLDALVSKARKWKVEKLIGYYLPTKKNGLVAEHYSTLGFTQTSSDSPTGRSTWTLDLSNYQMRNRHITVAEPAHE